MGVEHCGALRGAEASLQGTADKQTAGCGGRVVSSVAAGGEREGRREGGGYRVPNSPHPAREPDLSLPPPPPRAASLPAAVDISASRSLPCSVLPPGPTTATMADQRRKSNVYISFGNVGSAVEREGVREEEREKRRGGASGVRQTSYRGFLVNIKMCCLVFQAPTVLAVSGLF
ncbi:hypothetical protein E2C01_065666 [Portunus trituberculatus]|uniref:Uncharacterized protein n=1 Tax=Portunus trituberculatus TaxID=210409 RepID=A0A5B7HG71_PORTR|nr:hypothetical protein [Portunus trituberculatus]